MGTTAAFIRPLRGGSQNYQGMCFFIGEDFK